MLLLLLLAALSPMFIASALALSTITATGTDPVVTSTAVVTQTGSTITTTVTSTPLSASASPLRSISAISTFTAHSSDFPPSITFAAAATTVTLFFPHETGIGYGYLASVVAADACATTYGLVCTSGSHLGGADCPARLTDYFTYVGTSIFSISTRYTGAITVGSSTTAVSNEYIQACSIYGTTRAVCALTLTEAYGGNLPSSFSSSTTSTFTGDQVRFATVPVTAGASKLASARSSSCLAPSTSTSMDAAATTGTSTSTSTSKAAAAPTGGLYRAQLLAGAAGLLVGALA